MRVVRFVLLLVGAAILTLLITGHLNRLHPAFDSIGHFRLHFAVIGVLIGLLLIASKSLLGGAALAIVSALSFFTTVWPTIGTARAVAANQETATYRLLQSNLRFDNQTPEAFLRLLGETKPDVATLEEIPDMWLKRLQTIAGVYPYQHICPGRDKIGGVAIVSRRPFIADGLTYCDGDGAVAVQTVDFAGQPVTIAAMHLEWPWPKMQPQQLVWLQPVFDKIKTSSNRVLIGGDMNATPWSAALSHIAEGTGTRPLPQFRGTWFFNGWPRSLAVWLGLPIDNILSSNGIALHSATTQREIGSDHRPILIEFSLTPIAPPEEVSGVTG